MLLSFKQDLAFYLFVVSVSISLFIAMQNSCIMLYCIYNDQIFQWISSADSIERAFQILDQIPGRATGAYSHSQVNMDCIKISTH